MDQATYKQLRGAANAKMARQASFMTSSHKKKLREICERRIKTAFIGAIDTFEKRFGRLWGHGLQDEECNEKQLKCRELWKECREEILDKGNNEARNMARNLDNYDVKFVHPSERKKDK